MADGEENVQRGFSVLLVPPLEAGAVCCGECVHLEPWL